MGWKAALLIHAWKNTVHIWKIICLNMSYFAGDFSFADIQMSFPVVAMQERVKAHNPQMVTYAQRIQQRPAFKKAKELSGF